jgi:hypothetical protein
LTLSRERDESQGFLREGVSAPQGRDPWQTGHVRRGSAIYCVERHVVKSVQVSNLRISPANLAGAQDGAALPLTANAPKRGAQPG